MPLNAFEAALHHNVGNSAVSYYGPTTWRGAEELHVVRLLLPANWTSDWFPGYLSDFVSMPPLNTGLGPLYENLAVIFSIIRVDQRLYLFPADIDAAGIWSLRGGADP